MLGSTSYMPPQPPHMLREASWARPELSAQNSSHRTWFQEAFYSAPVGDIDSDDDSIEVQEESLRRHGRLDPGTTLHLLHESIRLTTGSRRTNRKSGSPCS